MRAVMSWVVIVAAVVAQPGGAQRLEVVAACREIVEEARRSGLTVGVAAVLAESDEVIFSSQADRLLVPASNMKIITAGAALLGPGPDHAIYTDLIAHGSRDGPVLNGYLRLRGEGDPTLRWPGVPDLLARRLAEAGIRSVSGGVVIDDRIFDQERLGPNWPKAAPTAEYLAEVSALSLDHATARLIVSAGEGPGDPAKVVVIPSDSGVSVFNRLVTCDSRKEHLINVTRAPGNNALTVTGKVALGTKDQDVAIAIHDPAMVFGQTLMESLARSGVVLHGSIRRLGPDEVQTGGQLIVRLDTKVSEVLPVMMKASQNHRADVLWKHLGAYVGEGGSFAGGGTAVRKVLGQAGVVLEGAVLADGSGLSRDNLLSADHFVGVLLALWRSPSRSVFIDSLPAGGEAQGTLRHRLKDLGRRVRAKTGSLRGVTALSGFVEPLAPGVQIAFSILTNVEESGRLRGREVEDRLVLVLSRLREVP